MTILSGVGAGSGIASGIVAHVSVERGRPRLDPELIEQLLQRRMSALEPLNVVLLVEDAALALLISLPPGGRLVGIVGELPQELPLAPEGVALVCGVGPARALAPDGTLVIVEPERGRVLLDPSARELARLQRDARPRLRLDGDSVPARTLGGREVAVWGEAYSLEEAEEALAAGADGLLYLAPLTSWDDALELARLVGGGDLTIGPGLTPGETVRLAARTALRLAVPTETDTDSLKDDWDSAQGDLAETNERTGLPRLTLRTFAPPPGPSAYDEILLEQLYLPDDLLSLPPLYLRLGTEAEDLAPLEEAIAAGICGVCVGPEQVATVKNAIRALP